MTTLQSIPRPLWGAFAILLAIVIGAKGVLEMRGGKILPGTTKAAFGLFSLNVGVWYMLPLLSLTATFSGWLPRAAVVVASTLPLTSLWLIQRFLPRDAAPKWLRPLRHWGAPAGTLLLILGAFLLDDNMLLWPAAFLHVFGFSAVGAVALWLGYTRTKGRSHRSILVFLVIFLVAVAAALADVMLVGADYLTLENQPFWPGTIAGAILLIALAEASERGRLLDLREIAAKGLTMFVLGLAMALVLTGLSRLAARVDDDAPDPWLATIAILTLVLMFLFDEIRSATNFVFTKYAWRADIGRAEGQIRLSLARATTLMDVGSIVVEHLPRSRQVGGAAFYAWCPRDDAFDCISSYDASPGPRISGTQLAGLLDRLGCGPVDLNDLVSDMQETTPIPAPALADERNLLDLFGNLRAALAVSARDRDGQAVGLLLVLRRTPQVGLFPTDLQALQRIADDVGAALGRLSAYEERRRHEVERTYGKKMFEKAHEMRGPLAGILNSARLLEQADNDPTLRIDSAAYHRAIIDQAKKADQYVAAVLDARRGEGHQTIVNRMVRDSVEQLRRDPKNTDLTIVLDLDTGVDSVCVEPIDFEHALRNLLENAVHATGGVGTIQVSTHLRPRTSEREPQRVMISVRDDGSGMSERIMSRIFRPAFSTKDRGNGIGLAMTQRIVESAGGTIAVTSTPQKGSVFAIMLPAASSA